MADSIKSLIVLLRSIGGCAVKPHQLGMGNGTSNQSGASSDLGIEPVVGCCERWAAVSGQPGTVQPTPFLQGNLEKQCSTPSILQY